MGKTVVVLGSGLVGIPAAHWLLKHVAPKQGAGFKVILVTPNSDFYWNLGSVRAIVPGQLGDEKLFYPLEPAFAHYPKGSFELVVGSAESLDPDHNTVVVSGLAGGAKRTVEYDVAVVATGSSFKNDMPFKSLGSTAETKASLHRYADRIGAAKTIVVAGAGSTGVEVAGEIAFEYAASGKKDVYLVSDHALPLYPTLKDDVRETALRELEKLKVKFVASARVTGATPTGKGGQTTLEITKEGGKKETLVADVYVPTFGVVPNTAFLPAKLLTDGGFVRTTPTLQVAGYANLFVAGDASDIQPPQGKHADDQVQHLVKNLDAFISGQGELAEYKPDGKILLGITIGRSKATGQIGNWKPFSILIWYFKGRYLGTDYAGSFAKGERTVQVKSW